MCCSRHREVTCYCSAAVTEHCSQGSHVCRGPDVCMLVTLLTGAGASLQSPGWSCIDISTYLHIYTTRGHGSRATPRPSCSSHGQNSYHSFQENYCSQNRSSVTLSHSSPPCLASPAEILRSQSTLGIKESPQASWNFCRPPQRLCVQGTLDLILHNSSYLLSAICHLLTNGSPVWPGADQSQLSSHVTIHY